MRPSGRQPWLRVALLVGIGYFLIGRLFAGPPDNVRVWRFAAWMVSGMLYAAHIGYGHFRLRQAPRSTALHTAVAVAIGAIALAVAGMIHALSTPAGIRPAWLLALVVWPAVTAIPAFLVALVAGGVLSRRSQRADPA